MKRMLGILCISVVLTGFLTAQDGSESDMLQKESSANFGFGLSIGTVTLDEQVYNTVRLLPELAWGNFALGLDIELRFTLQNNEAGDSEFILYQKDWYISEDATFQKYLNLYLSKFSYIRWGEERDSLYVRLGNLSGSNLGTGFIMGGYSNMMQLPELRVFGGQLNLDGNLFDFPYIGVEGLVSNLSQFDLFGGRLYVRPAAATDIPIVKNLELGGSIYVDRMPFIYLEDEDNSGYYDPFEGIYAEGTVADPLTISGVDMILPIFQNDLASMSLMGDLVFQGTQKTRTGGMVGLGGSLMFFRYNGQIRFLGKNFQPVYFDQTYDLQRASRYLVATEDLVQYEATTAYLASLGTSFLGDGLIFNVSVEGPFKAPENDNEYPHVKGILTLQPDVIEVVDFSFWYDKAQIKTLNSLVDPQGAIIGGLINYHMDPAVISLQVDAKYDPNNNENWKVTSQIRTGVQF